MENREVGEIWRKHKAAQSGCCSERPSGSPSECGEVQLIRKLVKERGRFYRAVARYGDHLDGESNALRDYGIAPETWKE